ncbi:MAG TPA: DNA-3-methyladenine glycosylase [Gemmatimonadaceae bacterium]|nr:DNA-3-methyladenine glycosylase [Gemmatimonadaceae bacterium]
MVPLSPAFYDRPTERVARDLLGRILETTVDGVRCRARIVETEAYLGEHDAACHAAAGRTARTDVLYGAPGVAYVYFVYGMHWCANAVTRREGLPSAVLIRAAEPVEGIAAMRSRRGAAVRDRDLTSGPGRLCAAMGITGRAHHGRPLWRGGIRILEGMPVRRRDILVTPRIGVNVAADWPMRFLVRGNPWVSARAQTARFLAGTRYG